MSLKNKKLWLVLSVFLAFFVFINTVDAQRKTAGDKGDILRQAVEPTGVSQADLPTTAGTFIRLALSISGLAFFVLMVYAGITWLTARGNEERVTKARNTMIAAILGLVVTVSAYAITNLIMGSLLEGPRESGPSGSIGGDQLGCCFDLVGTEYTVDVPFGDLTDQEVGYWTWRITTKSDCSARANDPDDPTDVIYGPGTYDFLTGFDAAACEEVYNERY